MAPPRDRERRTTLVAFLLLLVAVGTPVFLLVQPYVLTLLVAAILAVLTDPLYRRLRRRGLGQGAAGGLVTLGICLLVIIPVGIFTWAALQQAIALPTVLAGVELLDVDTQIDRLRTWGPARRLLADPAALQAQLQSTGARAATTATNLVLAALGEVPAVLLHAFLALLGSYFFLVDGERLLTWLSGKLPLPAQVLDVLRVSFRESAAAVVLASMAAAAAQAAVTLVTFLLLGVPGAYVAAGLTFLFSWVPFLGVAPVYLAGMAWAGATQGPLEIGLLLAAGCVAGVIDNVVRPAVLRGRQQMHPMVSLVAIFGGIAVFGIFGAFVGPILAAVFIALLEAWPVVARYAGVEVSETGTPPELDLPG